MNDTNSAIIPNWDYYFSCDFPANKHGYDRHGKRKIWRFKRFFLTLLIKVKEIIDYLALVSRRVLNRDNIN